MSFPRQLQPIVDAIDGVLPEVLDGPHARWDARIGVALSASIALLLLAFSPLFWLSGMGDIGVASAAFAAAFGFLARGYGAFGHRTALSLLLLLCYLLETFAVVRYGGPQSPFLAMLVLPTLYATLLGGVRAGLVWSAVTVTYLVALHSLDGLVSFGPLPGGRLFWLLTMPPLCLVSLAVVGTVLYLRDLSHAEVVEARLQAESANRAKGDFLAVVSHEMRSPLFGITGAAELLVHNPDDGESVRKLAGIVTRSSKKLSALVDDLLDLRRIEAGELTVRSEPFHPAQVLRDAIAMLRTDVGIRLDLAPDVPDQLLGDASRLGQVITNLLDNAVKFGAEAIIVRATGSLCVDVIDDGPGVPEDAVELIFEPFTQARGGSARPTGGSGIGLSISRRLMESMEGSLVLVPSLVGAHFQLQAPLCVPAGLRPIDEDETRALDLLLVDDEEDTGAILAGMLEREGHRVRMARDGASALAMCAASRPDLVLLDLHLPQHDGVEIASLIEAAHPGLAVIGHTAGADSRDLARAAEVGMRTVLRKPVEPDQLRAALRQWAGARQGAGEQPGGGIQASPGRRLDSQTPA